MPASTLPNARLMRLALVFAVSVLAACTAGGGDPDAGPSAISQLPCSTDAECADVKLVCDTIRRTCVCKNDAMCAGHPGGAYCNAFTGRCVADIAGCKGDSECSAGEFCDVAIRSCRAKKSYCQPCTQDEECGGAGDFCIHHPDFLAAPAFCGTECGGDSACPTGQTCRDTEKGKQCLPAVGRCNAASACVPDTNQACSRDGECSQGTLQVCETIQGRCVTGQRTCQPGQSCDPITLQCVQACRLDTECVARYGPTYTCLNNTCVPAETCTRDENCPPSKWCLKEPGKGEADLGVCANACGSDAECALGERCLNNPLTARRRCVNGCATTEMSSTDCPLTSVCVGGQCEFTNAGGGQRCQVKDVCAFREACLNLSCIPQPDHCKPTTGGCGAGAAATIYSNVQCGTAPSCPPGIAPFSQYEPACGGNIYGCPLQRCVYRCVNDSQCPKGFTCDRVLVGGSTGPWCFPQNGTLCR